MSAVLSAFGVDHGLIGKSAAAAGSDGDAKKNRRMAAVGLGASGVAAVGGVHALKTTVLNENRERKAQLLGRKLASKKPPEYAAKLARKIGPAKAAALLGAGWVGLHTAELGGDALAMRAQARELRQQKGGGS